jgi:hypothetical protein
MEHKHIGLQREAWGPRFWRVLHTLAEYSGRQITELQSNDEADAWTNLLRAQAFVMPCDLCKQHYLSWIVNYKINPLRDVAGETRRVYLRLWLWGCHDNVNRMNGKQSPSVAELELRYGKQQIQKDISELETMFRVAMDKQALLPADISRWKNALIKLRYIYHI